MTLPALANRLEAAGVKLTLRLVVEALPGALTSELKAALAAHRASLLMALAREAQWESLRHERWGPAVGDPTPGIEVGGRDAL
jgi:hypothetical protein